MTGRRSGGGRPSGERLAVFFDAPRQDEPCGSAVSTSAAEPRDPRPPAADRERSRSGPAQGAVLSHEQDGERPEVEHLLGGAAEQDPLELAVPVRPHSRWSRIPRRPPRRGSPWPRDHCESRAPSPTPWRPPRAGRGGRLRRSPAPSRRPRAPRRPCGLRTGTRAREACGPRRPKAWRARRQPSELRRTAASHPPPTGSSRTSDLQGRLLPPVSGPEARGTRDEGHLELTRRRPPRPFVPQRCSASPWRPGRGPR